MSAPGGTMTMVLVTHSTSASSRVLHGTVVDRRPHPRGVVLVVAPGEVVFYGLRTRVHRAFVFRTLATSEDFASEVPGVSPPVRLLLQTQTLGRWARLEELVRHLARSGRNPSSLSDAFYSRLNAVLGRKLPSSGRVIRALLDHEDAQTQVA
jgi:hypothetical protein